MLIQLSCLLYPCLFSHAHLLHYISSPSLPFFCIILILFLASAHLSLLFSVSSSTTSAYLSLLFPAYSLPFSISTLNPLRLFFNILLLFLCPPSSPPPSPPLYTCTLPSFLTPFFLPSSLPPSALGLADGRLNVWYQPLVAFTDKDLVPLTTSSAEAKGKITENRGREKKRREEETN